MKFAAVALLTKVIYHGAGWVLPSGTEEALPTQPQVVDQEEGTSEPPQKRPNVGEEHAASPQVEGQEFADPVSPEHLIFPSHLQVPS